MTDFVENSFSLNNNISISDKIKKTIPYFFIYFNPIDCVKNLNKNYKIVPDTKCELIQTDTKCELIQTEIKYKLITHINNKGDIFNFTSNNFLKSLYHLFFSLNTLHNNNISFTIVDNPFVYYENNLPTLMDFSFSFNFSYINLNLHNIKLFFPISLLKNKYIAFDVFIITYLINTQIDIFDTDCASSIIEQYTYCREKIDKETFT